MNFWWPLLNYKVRDSQRHEIKGRQARSERRAGPSPCWAWCDKTPFSWRTVPGTWQPTSPGPALKPGTQSTLRYHYVIRTSLAEWEAVKEKVWLRAWGLIHTDLNSNPRSAHGSVNLAKLRVRVASEPPLPYNKNEKTESKPLVRSQRKVAWACVCAALNTVPGSYCDITVSEPQGAMIFVTSSHVAQDKRVPWNWEHCLVARLTKKIRFQATRNQVSTSLPLKVRLYLQQGLNEEVKPASKDTFFNIAKGVCARAYRERTRETVFFNLMPTS